MRIDYSEPKQAYVAAQGKKRPHREPVGVIATIVIAVGAITFIAGFATGWLLSQRSAKRAFQAATEQRSLENSPKQESAMPAVKPQQSPPQVNTVPQQQAGTPDTQGAAGTQATPEPPLSFYKTLPGGQKNNVIGSGINAKEDKGKQPLQAAIPSNLTRPPQTGAETAKPAPERVQAAPEKANNAKPDANGFTVQVASYSLRSEAETMRNKLAGKGYNVMIVESNQGDKGTWYRVRVGRRLPQDAAKELAGKLGRGAIVIPDRE